jgi:heat shock protein HtpX
MNNSIRTFLLMTVLTVLFVWIGGELGGRNGAVLAFVAAGAINFFSYWFSDKMVLKRYQAQEASPDNNPRLYNMVAELVSKANLPMPKVYTIPEKNPNAFATGRNPSHAAVAATDGILNLLNDKELSGVMAHELTHVKNRDILTGTIAATFAGAIAMLGQFSRFSGSNRQSSKNPIMLILIMVGAPLIAIVIRMAISRVREYSADKGGAEISGEPLGLASALNKLQHGVQQIPISNGNPAHAHMFIVNPFIGGFQKLFSTHPPAEERIRRLKEMAQRRR